MPPKICLLFALVALGLPLASPAHHPAGQWRAQRLIAEGSPWNLHLDQANGPLTLRMLSDGPRIGRLPPNLEREARTRVAERAENVRALRLAAQEFDRATADGRLHLAPEYERDLREVLIAAMRPRPGASPSIRAHAPILKALPAYSRIRIFVPPKEAATVRKELKALNLSSRATLVIDDDAKSGEKLTPWVRDKLLVVDGGSRAILATPMRFYPGRRLAENDLRHLGRLRASGREVLRTPLFFRSGNLLLGRAGQRILFLGEGELYLNAAGYVQAHLARPDSAEVIAGLQALTGADRVVVLPNSDRLFHIDQYFAPLADGVAALLAPLDPERLPAEDARAIAEAGRMLRELGFRVVAIPTLAERVLAYQSPVNIVPFRDLQRMDRAALVPRFPDRQVVVDGRRRSLNQLVAEAYGAAGTRAILVEDHFSDWMGNTHCAAVPLR